jgi:peptidylprolyl isomerase
MNSILNKLFSLSALFLIISCNAPGGNDNTIVSIITSMGDIKIKLYDGTPRHRDNFIRLIKAGFYDGISFHRIIKNFMIQAGDPATSKGVAKNFPDSVKTYTIPAEFNIQYFHKKGALAAARQGNDVNPEMKSSGTQFYIVQGVILKDEDLNLAEQRINSNIKQALFKKILKETADSVRLSQKTLSDAEMQEIASLKMFQYLADNKAYRISEEQRNTYKNIGGTPLLDGTYTVFGEVIEGLNILDKIADVPTDSNNKPLNDIKILNIKIIRK